MSSPESAIPIYTFWVVNILLWCLQGTKFGPITFIGMIDSAAAANVKTHTF